MKRKKLEIFRGGSHNPVTLENGDKYDSYARLFDETNQVIFKTDVVNTDPSIRFAGKCGILSKGTYYGIMGYRWNDQDNAWTGKRVIKVFNTNTMAAMIGSHADLSDDNMTVDSEIPNPNWDNKKILKYVQLHDGGANWDWSEGCITFLNQPIKGVDWQSWAILSSKIKDNEIIDIILK